MERMQLRCGCGFRFVAGSGDLQTDGSAKCPSCLNDVPLDGPAPGDRPKVVPRVLETSKRPGVPRVWILGGAGAALLVAGAVVVAILASGSRETLPGNAPVEQRTPSSKPSIPAPPPPGSVKAAVAPPSAPAPKAPPVPAAKVRKESDTGASPVQVIRPGGLVLPPPETQPLPVDVLARLNEMVKWPDFYLGVVADEKQRERSRAIAARGRAAPEEAAMVKALLDDPRARSVTDEIRQVGEDAARLEKQAIENLPRDLVVLKSGARINCRVIEEKPDQIKIERIMQGGVGGTMGIPRENIQELGKGKGAGAEFAVRLAETKTVAGLAALLAWSKENTLLMQAQLVASRIAMIDPSHVVARSELGLPANLAQEAELVAKEGSITYQNRAYTPKRLKDKLQRDGYVLMFREWHLRKDKMISIPGLFRYDRQDDKPVQITSADAGLTHDEETVFKSVLDVSLNAYVEKAEVKQLRRFYTPAIRITTPDYNTVPNAPGSTSEVIVRYLEDALSPIPDAEMKGEVVMLVPVNAPIIEASVFTLAEVKPGASITISFVGDNGRVKLYDCAQKEDDFHKIPTELVRGRREVGFVASIRTTSAFRVKEERRRIRAPKKAGGATVELGLDVIHRRKIPDYRAVLFPSNSNTLEVFRLRAVIGEPAPALTRLFADHLDVLAD